MIKFITIIAVIAITLLSNFISGQTKITLNDGNSILVKSYKEMKGTYRYLDINGVGGAVETSNVISVIEVEKLKDMFQFNENGLTDYLVKEFEGVSQQELFDSTVNWIKETYKNPEEVIKARIDNEKVRFEGFKSSAFNTTVLFKEYRDGKYSIEISFKEGKLKFDPIGLEQFTPSSKYVTGGWSDIPLNVGAWSYRKNGKLRSTFKTYPSSIETIFNEIIASLNDYLLKKSNKKEDSSDDW